MDPSPRDRLVQQLIRRGVLKTPALIRAFKAINRADFVLPELAGQEYADTPLPIGFQQTISQPYTVAFMLEKLSPRAGETVLDVGSGSGWQTALLAHVVGQGGKVVGLEVIPELHQWGMANVSRYGFIEQGIVEMHCLSALGGYPAAAPFDRIVAAAAGEAVPPAWQGQLAVGGRIVTPVGSSILVLERTGTDTWQRRDYQGFAFVPLVGA